MLTIDGMTKLKRATLATAVSIIVAGCSGIPSASQSAISPNRKVTATAEMHSQAGWKQSSEICTISLGRDWFHSQRFFKSVASYDTDYVYALRWLNDNKLLVVLREAYGVIKANQAAECQVDGGATTIFIEYMIVPGTTGGSLSDEMVPKLKEKCRKVWPRFVEAFKQRRFEDSGFSVLIDSPPQFEGAARDDLWARVIALNGDQLVCEQTSTIAGENGKRLKPSVEDIADLLYMHGNEVIGGFSSDKTGTYWKPAPQQQGRID